MHVYDFVDLCLNKTNGFVKNWEQILACLFPFSLYCRTWTNRVPKVIRGCKGDNMEKIYQVSEAAEELETEVYTLRYWENQLGLEVPRNAAGHRYYEETQIVMFRNVKRFILNYYTPCKNIALAELLSNFFSRFFKKNHVLDW